MCISKLIGSVAVAAILGIGAASAADLPMKAPPPAVAPVWSWTGIYIGGDVGGRWTNDARWTTTCLETGQPGSTCNNLPGDAAARLAAGNPANFDSSTFKGGAFVGYNWQVNPNWVLGVEADVQWGDSRKTIAGIPGAENPAVAGAPGLDSSRLKETWDASLRGRVGVLVSPTWMLFGTGGVAFMDVQQSAFCGTLFPVGWCGIAANIGRTSTASETRVGWTLGAGIEGMFARNWLVRGEYRFADYGTMSSVLMPGPTINIDAFSSNVRLQTHTVLVGVAYKFDSVAPVVAKY
jgi:outer membrane immunogenic protein